MNMPDPQRKALMGEIRIFVQELATEGERAAVVLGTARIDVELERLLKKIMRHNNGGSDNLFDADRPLGTLSAKITLAHRLNLIDDNVEHALQMLRKIRNDFAHSISKSSLSESHHKNRVRELVRATRVVVDEEGSYYHTTIKELFVPEAPEILGEFCAAIFMILTVLQLSTLFAEPLSPKCRAAFV